MYTEGTVMVYAVPEEKNRVTARTVYTEVRVNRGEGVYLIWVEILKGTAEDD